MEHWVFIGWLLGSMVTSDHPTREACEGRAVILREKSVVGRCVSSEASDLASSPFSGHYQSFPSITIAPGSGTLTVPGYGQ